MRQSEIYTKELQFTNMEDLVKRQVCLVIVKDELVWREMFSTVRCRYAVDGYVGDQEWLTQLSWKLPQLFHLLPCQVKFRNQVY